MGQEKLSRWKDCDTQRQGSLSGHSHDSQLPALEVRASQNWAQRGS